MFTENPRTPYFDNEVLRKRSGQGPSLRLVQHFKLKGFYRLTNSYLSTGYLWLTAVNRQFRRDAFIVGQTHLKTTNQT